MITNKLCGLELRSAMLKYNYKKWWKYQTKVTNNLQNVWINMHHKIIPLDTINIVLEYYRLEK